MRIEYNLPIIDCRNIFINKSDEMHGYFELYVRETKYREEFQSGGNVGLLVDTEIFGNIIIPVTITYVEGTGHPRKDRVYEHWDEEIKNSDEIIMYYTIYAKRIEF